MSNQKENQANYQGAKELVWEQLANLNTNLFYHGRHHTFEDVLPNAILLSEEEGITDEEKLIVKTAALFHDTGFLDQYEKNEPFGAQRARKYLPSLGYSEQQIEKICQCIMATQMPQSPGDEKLAQIVCDADLAHLGTDKFFLRAEALRLELSRIHDKEIPVLNWHKGNLSFLKNQTYFTESAKKLLQPIKDKNYEATYQLVYKTPEQDPSKQEQ